MIGPVLPVRQLLYQKRRWLAWPAAGAPGRGPGILPQQKRERCGQQQRVYASFVDIAISWCPNQIFDYVCLLPSSRRFRPMPILK